MPAVSPDGRTLAFVRSGTAEFGTVNVVNLSDDLRSLGEPRSLTDAKKQIVGLTWSSDGREVIYAAGVIPRMRLWRQEVSGAGNAERLEFSGTSVARPVLSGGRLAYESFIAEKNIWRQPIDRNGEPIGERRQFASSSRWDSFPSFSPDGRRIVFVSSRSGTRQLWVCEEDGTGLRSLTSLPDTKVANARWSPNGREIAFGARPDGSGEIYVVDVESGDLRKVTEHPADDTQPSWSADGEWITFRSNREPPGLWMIPSRKGNAKRVRGRELGRSGDGRLTFFIGGPPGGSEVWKELTSGGERIPIPELRGCQFPVLLQDRIFFVAFGSVDAMGPSFTIRRYDTNTDELKTILDIQGSFGFGFSVSPDGSTILYSAFDLAASDLMLAENFR
jgi:Tol biopolymer transport system component